MTEYNLTLGQAIEKILDNQKVEIETLKHLYLSLDGNEIFFYCKCCDRKITPFNINLHKNKIYKLYEPKPKQKNIKWYRPKVYFYEGNKVPQINLEFYKDKNHFLKLFGKVKVLNDEWEMIEAPENFEDW